ncbi:MAG: hypothetical protein ACRYFU_13605 [Janthinobacterium lividum]
MNPAFRKQVQRLFLFLSAVLFSLSATSAHAHVGSKDVFEQISSGPYKFFVTIRPPTVVPGVAVVEVRIAGPTISSLEITPIPLTGEASKHPPTADAMQRSGADPNFFTGSLWLMSSGSWQVRLQAQGAGGPATANIPVPAVALSVLKMQRPMGVLLATLGLLLVFGMVGIFYGAVREARLVPGQTPSPDRTRRATIAAGITLAILGLMVWGGDTWWNVAAADYSADLYHPLQLHPVLTGSTLDLQIDRGAPDERGARRSNADLLPDHGHLMHLYAIRWPQMDAAYHLHPALVGPGDLRTTVPDMPVGTYHLYGDIVHRSGFPETLTATLVVPPNASRAPLDNEDAAAHPQPLSAGDLGVSYKLPDGYTMVWDRPTTLTANTAELFRFTLLDPAREQATDMQPYLGMAGHAAFVKTDGTVFAHTHPDGSAAMPAMMLANAGMSDMSANAMADMNAPTNTGMGGVDAKSPGKSPEPLDPIVEFPYGFPSAGRYRIFIQMKHGGTVETGVFDAEVK